MTSAQADAPVRVLNVQCDQRLYPAYDPFHGTNAPMLWRLITIETPAGTAAFEQTDYGHPGRLNPWEPRGVGPALVPKLKQLEALAQAAGELLS